MHCQQYGLSLRQCFKDFDKVNRGTVTIAQFERNLPRSAGFEPVHMTVKAAIEMLSIRSVTDATLITLDPC